MFVQFADRNFYPVDLHVILGIGCHLFQGDDIGPVYSDKKIVWQHFFYHTDGLLYHLRLLSGTDDMIKYLIGILLLLSVNHTMAQRNACCMPDNGYWELVTNIHDPTAITVRFYDLESHLIDQEKMTSVPNSHKKKTCRWLNERLQSALVAWQRTRHREQNFSAAFI